MNEKFSKTKKVRKIITKAKRKTGKVQMKNHYKMKKKDSLSGKNEIDKGEYIYIYIKTVLS